MILIRVVAIESVEQTLGVLWSGEVTEDEMVFLEAQWRGAGDTAYDTTMTEDIRQ